MSAKKPSKTTMLITSWRSLSSVETHRKSTPLPMCRSSSREKRFWMIVKVWQRLAFSSWALSMQWIWVIHQSWNTHLKCFRSSFLSLTSWRCLPKSGLCTTNLYHKKGVSMQVLEPTALFNVRFRGNTAPAPNVDPKPSLYGYKFVYSVMVTGIWKRCSRC